LLLRIDLPELRKAAEVRLNGEEEGRIQTPTWHSRPLDEYFLGFDDTAYVFLRIVILHVGD
jgi:hypothetical protein